MTTLQGYVRGSAGKPLTGVFVMIQGSSHLYTTLTNEAGYWARSIADDVYEVTFLKGGYSMSPDTMTVTVSGQASIALPDVTGLPGDALFNVQGTIIGGGVPIPGILVQTDKGQQAVTAANGTFVLSGLAPGDYVVTPISGDWMFTPASISVTVVNSDLSDLQFVASSTLDVHKISGYVKDSGGVGISGVSLRINDQYSQIAISDGDGYYEFLNLGPGTYVVTPSTITGTLAPTSQSITVVDSDVVAADFIFTQGAGLRKVSGTVTDGTDPLYGVYVRTDNNGITPVQTDATGKYTLMLPDGAYTIFASKMSYTIPSVDITVAGSDLTGVDLVGTISGATHTISGYVMMAGAPVSGVTIRAGTYYGQTDSDGHFAVSGLRDGAYQVFCGKTGYVFTPSPNWVTVNGADITGLSFEASLASSVFSISGLVKDGSGNPLSGVLVFAGTAQASTDAAGAFTISGLSVGTYMVTPSLSGYLFSPEATSVSIVSEDITGVDFTALQDVPLSEDLPYTLANGNPPDADKIMADLSWLSQRCNSIRNAQISRAAGINPTKIASGLAPPRGNLLADLQWAQSAVEALQKAIEKTDTFSAWNMIDPVDVDLEIVGVGATGAGGYLSVREGKRIRLYGHEFVTKAQRVPADETAYLAPESAYALRAEVDSDGSLKWNLVPLDGRSLGPDNQQSSEHYCLQIGTVTDGKKFVVQSVTGKPVYGARCVLVSGDGAGEEFDITYYNESTGDIVLPAALTTAPATGDWVGLHLDDPNASDPPGELGGESTPESCLVALIYTGAAGAQPYVLMQGGSVLTELPWSNMLNVNKGDETASSQTINFESRHRPIKRIFGKMVLFDTNTGDPDEVSYQPLNSVALPVYTGTANVAKGVNVDIYPDHVVIKVSDGHLCILHDDGTYTPAKGARFKVWLEH